MSLNVRVDPAGLVLRAHQPFVSRQRLRALQAVRQQLADRGLVVLVPVERAGSTLFRCGDRWAELETYIPHMRPDPIPASYLWLFGAMGHLHQALRSSTCQFRGRWWLPTLRQGPCSAGCPLPR